MKHKPIEWRKSKKKDFRLEGFCGKIFIGQADMDVMYNNYSPQTYSAHAKLNTMFRSPSYVLCHSEDEAKQFVESQFEAFLKEIEA